MTHGQWRSSAIVLAGALTFLTLHLFFILTWDRFFNSTAWPGYEASAAAGLIEPWFVNTPASLWLTRIVLFAATVAITLLTGGRIGASALAYFTGAASSCAALWATTRAHAVEWGWLGSLIYPFRLALPIVTGAALVTILRSPRPSSRPHRQQMHTDSAPTAVPARWWILLRLIARLPQRAISRFTGRVARLTIPRPLRPAVLGAFARSAGIDTAEIERPVASYASLDEFFVRRLRPGAREWPQNPDVVTSPVDGVIGESGPITSGRVLQAKGISWEAADLLGDHETARTFDGGEFLTIYLSPRHYHRIHAPASGRIRSARHVPGSLMPVNPPAMASITDLLPRNERLVCGLGTDSGRIAIIAVGAFNVGRITAEFDPDLVTNQRGARATERVYEPGIEVDRGEEIMAFHLGSTIVLFFERGTCSLADDLASGREIRLGQPVATPLPR